MGILIKIVAAVLLSITLSGAVMAASEDLKDSARMALVMRGEPQALGIEYNASGTARTITLDPTTFRLIMNLSVDGLSPYAQSLISGFQHACKPLLETPCEGLNCLQIAAQWQINLTSKEFTLNSDAPDLGIPHDFVIGLKKKVLDYKVSEITNKYAVECSYITMLAVRERSYYIRAGTDDSSGYRSLEQLVAHQNILQERRRSLTDNFDVAPILAEYETLFSKAKKFRGGPGNKNLKALLDDAFIVLLSSEEYNSMKAGLIEKARAYGAVIIPDGSDTESHMQGFVSRFDGTSGAGGFVYALDYDSKETELEELVQRLDEYTSNGYKVTSEPIPEKDVKSICSGCSRGRKYFTKNPDLTASVQSHPATSGDSDSSSVLDPWLDVD